MTASSSTSSGATQAPGGAGGMTASSSGTGGTGGVNACPQPCACPAGGSGTRACVPEGPAYGLCVGCTAPDAPWSKTFGAPALVGNSKLGAVAGDDGVLAVTWNFDNTAPDLGDVDPIHLRRFDPAGNPLWDEGIHTVRDAAVDADGSVIVAFSIDGDAPVSLLGTEVACAASVAGSGCGGLARIGADGTLAWVRTLEAQGDKPWVWLDTLRIAGNGRLVVSGMFHGTIDLGSGPLAPNAEGQGVFVAELMADGAAAWGRAVHFFYPPGSSFKGWYWVDVAVSPAGDVVVAGKTQAPVDLGDGVMMPAFGYENGFFGRYDAAGNVVHRGVFAAPDTSGFPTVAVDAAGNTVVASWVRGPFDLGGGTTGAPGQLQLYLARFDPTGSLLGGKTIAEVPSGQGNIDFAFPLAIDAADNAWLCGSMAMPFALDGALVQPVSQGDALVLQLDPAGNLVSHWQFGTTGWLDCDGIRVGPGGVPVINGHLTGSVDFGQGLLQSTGDADAFIAKLGPGGAVP